MMKQFLLPIAAGAAIFGAAALIPAPASAQLASAAAAIDVNARDVSSVIEVQRRDRRRHWGHRHHGRWQARPFFYAPYAYYPRRCGYVWSPRYHRQVYRCW